MEYYNDDLAYIHDVGFGSFSIKAAPGLLAMLRRNRITKGLVVDLGCGSGLWARELSSGGYGVLGIDISASMINIARKRVPKAKFRKGSFLDVKLPQCDAVTSLGECFNYLFDKKNSKKKLVTLFRHVHNILYPGGIFIFDIREPVHAGKSGAQKIYLEGKDWVTLLHITENEQRNELTRRITTFRKIGQLYRRGQEIHRQRLYKGTELVNELRRVGFRVRILRGYGRLRFTEAHVGFLARKPYRKHRKH